MYIPPIGFLYNALELGLALTELVHGSTIRSIDSWLGVVVSDTAEVLCYVELICFSNGLHLIRKQDIKVLERKLILKKTISVVSSNLRGSEKKEPVEETLIVFLLSVQEVSKGSGLYSAENTQSAVIDRYLS